MRTVTEFIPYIEEYTGGYFELAVLELFESYDQVTDAIIASQYEMLGRIQSLGEAYAELAEAGLIVCLCIMVVTAWLIILSIRLGRNK